MFVEYIFQVSALFVLSVLNLFAPKKTELVPEPQGTPSFSEISVPTVPKSSKSKSYSLLPENKPSSLKLQ